MSAECCRWCLTSLRDCLIQHVNDRHPCCKACDHPTPIPQGEK